MPEIVSFGICAIESFYLTTTPWLKKYEKIENKILICCCYFCKNYFDRFLTSHFDIYFGVEVDAEKFRKNLHFPKSNR